MAFSKQEKALIRALQEDLPLVQNPFAEIGRRVGMGEDEVIRKVQAWKTDGIIRRFGSVLNHRRVGIQANGMGVWKVDPDRVEEAGRIMASFSEVSHCYERRGWDYNLFTMIHGESREICERVAREISERTGIKTYRILYSTRELKKSSMRYFVEDDQRRTTTC